MRKADGYRLSALALLAITTLYFRNGHESPIDFICGTAAVITFWALHSLKISRFNLRALLLLLFLFGIPFVLVRQLPIFATTEATTGPWTEDHFDPANVGEIQLSHQVALQAYFDHRPNESERYFKTGSFEQSQDGLYYRDERLMLDPEKMPKAEEWARRNLQSKTLAEKIKIVEAWFRQDLRYSLNPGRLKSAHPLDEFLFERQRGYCQHFAAALTSLLKLSGIRARVAVGFQGGSWNPWTQELTYEMADSHAWVEAYDPAQRNWLRLDPTAWVGTSEEQRSTGVPRSAIIGILIAAMFILLFAKDRRTDPLQLLTQKLTRFESRRHLESAGLTLEERMIRMMEARPSLAPRIRRTLELYQNTYFRNEPNSEMKRQLRSSIRHWRRGLVDWFVFL